MSDESLCYDQLAFKASHNSYQRDEKLLDQLKWNDSKPYNCGCRGLELDIVRHSDGSSGANASYFQVTHDQGATGPHLSTYLGDLKKWHDSNGGHDPILVCLDIKSEQGSIMAFAGEIDTYLRTWFGQALICTPGSVIIDKDLDLVGNLQQHGWPLLSALKGKFLFCLSGTSSWKATYAVSSPAERLCFADFDVNDTETWNGVTAGPCAVANLHLYSDDYDKWKKLVPSLRAQHLLVRGYVLNSQSLWQNAQRAGVNMLATDKVSGYEWAKIGSEPFALSTPQAG